MHDDGFIPFIIFLEFEGDCNGVGESQKRVVEQEDAMVPEELEVSEAKAFCAPFATDAKIFARVHGKEEGVAGELMGGLVEFPILVATKFPKYTGSEGLLGFCRRVLVFIAL
jgi:hypothetical protein